jgi:hypothetical protein
MTPKHRRTLIIETIRAIQIGTLVSKGLVTILLEPWPGNHGLICTAMPWCGRVPAGSICFRPPPLGSNVFWND